MTWLNASWQRLSEPHKWLWRVVMFVLTILNGWECFRHVTANNPMVAAIDAIFVAVGVGVIVASFVGVLQNPDLTKNGDTGLLTKEQARALVTERLEQMNRTDDPWIVVDSATIERPFGWVFFFNSKEYLESGRIHDALAGNGPVIANRHDGSIEFYGASKPVELVIQEYEARWSKH